MNSETIIVGVGCLYLAIAFLLFRPQIFILLNRLAHNGLLAAENLPKRAETIVPRDTKPWNWYKAWTISLLHPSADTSKALLSEGNISFLRALIWIVVASIVFEFLYSIILWIKFPYPINSASILNFLQNCFLAGLFSPVVIIMLTGFIHIISKLFGSKETFQNFFIIYVAFNAPVMILYIAMALIWQISRIKIVLCIDEVFIFYFLFLVTAKAIKSYYRFSRLRAFLINLFVQVVFFVSLMVLVTIANPSIINP